MGTLHLVVSVFALIWKTPRLLKLKKTISFFSWSDSKWAHLVHCEEIFNSKLVLLTPLWQAVLGLHCLAMVHATWRQFTLLGDCSQLLGNSSRWSHHEFDCSASFALARTSSRRCCTMGTRRSGTSYGGYDPGYPRQTTWAALPGAIQPIRRSLVEHGAARCAP